MAAAFAVATVVNEKIPFASKGVPVMVVAPSVCESEHVYVPVPPVPVPNAVMSVFAVTLVPVILMPTASAPDVTAVTVSVVPDLEPVTTAPAVACTGTDANMRCACGNGAATR